MGAGEGRINRERRLMGVTVREELGPKKGGEKREKLDLPKTEKVAQDLVYGGT